MKIQHISVMDDEGGAHVTLHLDLPGMVIADAVAQVLSLFAEPAHHVMPRWEPEVVQATAQVEPNTDEAVTPAQWAEYERGNRDPQSEAKRTRRPRSAAPEAAPPAEEAPAETTRSRRRPAAPEAPANPVISDAELSKAASHAAVEIPNGEGPGIVLAVLEDFGVKTVNDLPQDQRQKFLDDIAEEIRLAKEAAAS